MASKLHSPIDIPFSRGIRQDVESRLAPTGCLYACTNLELDRFGDLVRRDGFSQCSTSTFSKTTAYTGPARRLATGWNGERLAFCDDTAFTYVQSKDKFCEAGPRSIASAVRCTLNSTRYIGADPAGTIISCDVGYASPFVVVTYTQLVGTTFSLFLDVINSVTGEHVLTGEQLQSGIAAAAAAVQARVMVSGSIAFVFVYTGNSGGFGQISYARLDLSTTIPSGFIALTNIVSDGKQAAAGAVFDVVPTQGGFCLAYVRDNGAGGYMTRVKLYTTASTPVQIGSSYDWTNFAANAAWSANMLAIRGASSVSERIQLIGCDTGVGNVEQLQTEFDLSLPKKASFAPTVTPMQLSIVRETATRSLVAYSDYAIVGSGTQPRGHLYYGDIDYNAANPTWTQGAYPFSSYSVGSRFYVDSAGYIFALGRFNESTQVQSHLLMLDFGTSPNVGRPVPQAHIGNGRTPTLTSTAIGGAADMGSGLFVCANPINVGASSLSGMQIELSFWESRGQKRYLSAQASGALVVGGATPLVYDGQRLVELGFYSYPLVAAANSSGVAGAGYAYRFVWEWVDSTGNRHQSIASPAASVTALNTTWTIASLHATRKQTAGDVMHASVFSDGQAPVRLVAYRTPLNGTNYYRVNTVAVNSATATTIQLQENVADATIILNEQLPESLSKLTSSCAPPTLLPVVHAQRLWGVDQERVERIWCTKVFEDLESPGYNAALQVVIPGAGAIKGLAGQDGKLYALATNGIYLASYGDGPTNTGQGGFPTPTLATITANCTEPRSVLVGQEGIYFAGQARWGTTIYLIKRGDGSPLDIGKGVRDELLACPIVRGAIQRNDKSRAEFLIVDSDTAPTKARILYYHQDLVDEEGIGAWTIAQFIDGRALHCIGTWGDAAVVSDVTTGGIAIQTAGVFADRGSTFPATVDTCDIRPFGILGYGQVDAVSLLSTKTGLASIKFLASYDSGATYSAGETWETDTSGDSASGPALRRWDPPTHKLPSGTVRYRITDSGLSGAPSTAGTIWHGLSIEVSPLGGNVRLPAAQMG